MENDGDGQVLHVHVQQIAYDQKLATVYVVELGERYLIFFNNHVILILFYSKACFV